MKTIGITGEVNTKRGESFADLKDGGILFARRVQEEVGERDCNSGEGELVAAVTKWGSTR